MKKICCLVLSVFAITSVLVGCEGYNINKANIETKEGYIIDYNIESKEKSFIFYENKKDNILSVNLDTIPNNIAFDTLDIYVDRYKINIFKNKNDKYELNSMKIIGTPKKKNVNNNEELDFNNVVGERLLFDTPEENFIMKICYPHYYFNKVNYDRGEYLPDKKINSSMCLEYFMWLNDWSDYVYLTPQKMGKYYASEYDTDSFIKKAKEFFPLLKDNSFEYLPLYGDEVDCNLEQYLFYDDKNNILKLGMCGLGGAGILKPYLRSFEYIDKNTVKVVLMDAPFQDFGEPSIDEWEYIFTLKDDDTWEFQKIDYLQNN